MQGDDGRLWYPAIAGAVIADPEALEANARVPQVAIEQVLVDGRVAASSAPMALPAGSRTLTVRFTALTFRAPHRVWFRYRLGGCESEWQEPGTRRSAYYMNIPPGTCSLRVIAANDNGVCNTTGTSLSFVPLPRFYQTMWFSAPGVAAIGLVVGCLVRVRIRAADREQATETSRRSSCSLRRPDGTWRPVEGLVVRRFDDPAVGAPALNLRGISDRRPREAAVAANTAKSQFPANMNHEMRTPLNAIQGFAEIIADAPADEQQRDLAGLIVSESRSLLDVINEILDLAKVEAGHVEISTVPLDLEALLQHTQSALGVNTTRKGLTRTVELRPRTPRYIVGDPPQLRQVLPRLAGNAITFTEWGSVAAAVELVVNVLSVEVGQ